MISHCSLGSERGLGRVDKGNGEKEERLRRGAWWSIQSNRIWQEEVANKERDMVNNNGQDKNGSEEQSGELVRNIIRMVQIIWWGGKAGNGNKGYRIPRRGVGIHCNMIMTIRMQSDGLVVFVQNVERSYRTWWLWDGERFEGESDQGHSERT